VNVAVDSADALLRVLDEQRALVVGAACTSIRLGRTSYESAGEDETLRRIEALYEHLLEAVATRNLGGVVDHARRLAGERFRSGYDLSEVQGAFNALEEATWTCLSTRMQPDQLGVALGLVSTVFGAAKDALACEYVSLASRTHTASLDMRALFTGGTGA
jgi:hypothetical protein